MGRGDNTTGRLGARARELREKRKPDTGMIRPYRPAPADFREVFIRLGWGGGIEEHYRTNYRIIARWIEECGGDQLRAERAKVGGRGLRPGNRSKRYALTAVTPDAQADKDSA